MSKLRAPSDAMALTLIGLIAAFVGCSGSVATGADGCDYNGTHHASGETFLATDGCNHCSCGDGGEPRCTLVYCEDPLFTRCTTPNGQTYAIGQQVSDDGCNTCTCSNNGLILCTMRDCADAGNSCDSLIAEMKDTLARAQKCNSATECGQRIPASSCGGTRDLIARNDADLTQYLAQRSAVNERGCETEGGSICDEPAADGFACIDHVCGWNYVNIEPSPDPEPTCKSYEAAELCVRGTPTADGESLAAGDQLQVLVRSAGCFSSSCSQVTEAACKIRSDSAFNVDASFCVADTSQPGKLCTADCGNAHADCSFGQPLTAGEHQVKLGSIVVGFQVPGKFPPGGLCASSR